MSVAVNCQLDWLLVNVLEMGYLRLRLGNIWKSSFYYSDDTFA